MTKLVEKFTQNAIQSGAKFLSSLDANENFIDAYCGIAETGTLVFLSNLAPISKLFLPETLNVSLKTNRIVAKYEDALEKIIDNPRCIHFITGPSRTGDIEQKILIGAHGPKHLNVFLDPTV